MSTQKNIILSYLQDGNFINKDIAIGIFECKSLSKVISRLKDDGHDIISEKIELGNHLSFTQYFLNPTQ